MHAAAQSAGAALPPATPLTAFPEYATLPAVLDGSEPEQLLASSALDEPAALAFLQQNFPSHFSDVADTARAADALSAAACLAAEAQARPWLATALKPFFGSIACRAVTTCVRHCGTTGQIRLDSSRVRRATSCLCLPLSVYCPIHPCPCPVTTYLLCATT
jgi:hypothetical protein